MKLQITISMILCAMCLTSCGNTTNTQNIESQIAETEKVEVQSTEVADNDTLTESTEIQNESPAEEINELIFDESGISVWYKGATEKEDKVAFSVYIENNSDQKITLQTRDVSVNDFQSRLAFSPTIEGGKKMNYDMRLIDSELKKNNLTFDTIEKLEFNFHIIYEDSDLSDYDSGKIVITP